MMMTMDAFCCGGYQHTQMNVRACLGARVCLCNACACVK